MWDKINQTKKTISKLLKVKSGEMPLDDYILDLQKEVDSKEMLPIYIEYIADYRYYRLKKMGMNAFVYKNLGIKIGKVQLTTSDINDFLETNNLTYDWVMSIIGEKGDESGWAGTVRELLNKKPTLK